MEDRGIPKVLLASVLQAASSTKFHASRVFGPLSCIGGCLASSQAASIRCNNALASRCAASELGKSTSSLVGDHLCVSPTALRRRIDCARVSFDLCNQPRTAADRFDQKMQADTEEYLHEAAGRGHEMVQQMVQKLSGALIYPDAGNVQTNEKLWDVYASEWGAEAGWVAGMAASNRDEAEKLENVGDEWAPAAHTKRVVDEWILSEVSVKTQCCEIGSGGGRIGRMVAPRVAKLQCFDVSAKMLAAAKSALSSEKNVAFAQIHGDASGSTPASPTSRGTTLRNMNTRMILCTVLTSWCTWTRTPCSGV